MSVLVSTLDTVQLLATPVNIMWLGSIQQDPNMQSAIVQALYGTITNASLSAAVQNQQG
jgi:hypothetical protein